MRIPWYYRVRITNWFLSLPEEKKEKLIIGVSWGLFVGGINFLLSVLIFDNMSMTVSSSVGLFFSQIIYFWFFNK